MNRKMADLSHNPAFAESVALLLCLHDLIAEGKGDDEEAEVIRDRMEAPWHEMTPVEKDLTNGLSADIYTIGRTNGKVVSTGPGALVNDEFTTAVSENNWPKVLELVRLQQDSLDSDEAAFVRAVAWMHLGYPEVALRFFREIERLRSLDDGEQIWLLTCLMQTKRIEEISATARRFASSANPQIRLRASTALSLAAQHLHDGNVEKQRKLAMAIAEEALPQIEPLIAKDRTAKVLWLSTLFQLALDYEEIGEKTKAIAACQRILEQEPNNFNAQILMDWLTYEEDPVQARRRFRGHLRQQLPQRTAHELPSLVVSAAK